MFAKNSLRPEQGISGVLEKSLDFPLLPLVRDKTFEQELQKRQNNSLSYDGSPVSDISAILGNYNASCNALKSRSDASSALKSREISIGSKSKKFKVFGERQKLMF